MRCLLAGQVRGHVSWPGKPGFASLSFEERDVIETLDRMGTPGRSGNICPGDVVRRLSLLAAAIHQLVKADLLPPPTRNGAFIFDADAVDGFRYLFTYDTALARQKRVQPTEIREALSILGLHPLVTINLRNAVTVAVYRRMNVEIRS